MSIQTIELVRFNPQTASEDVFQELIALQTISFQERNPDDTPPPYALMKKNLEMMPQNPFVNIVMYLARNHDNRLDAFLMMGYPKPENPEYEAQKHMGFVSMFVRPEARRSGIGTLLLKKIVGSFQENGLTLIQADTQSDAGRAFATKFGSSVAIEARTSRVYTKDIDWAMIEAWQQEGEANNPDTKLEVFAGLPAEEDLEAFCQLFTEVVNQQPFGELEGAENSFTPERMKELNAQQQEMGEIEYTMISREADGRLSGLTEIAYNSQRPHMANQGLTGVQMDERGRGLGKWLKAALLLHFRETYPDVQYINTTNATVNEAMLSINNRMGFKLHSHNTMFKLQVEEAAKHLS